MALFEFNDNEKASMELLSSVNVPEKPVYEQDKYRSLGEVMNSTIALASRADYNARTYDLTAYEGVEFSRDNALNNLKSRNLSPSLIERVMDVPASSWQQFEANLAFQSHLAQAEEQVNAEFSTAAKLTLGIPLAIVDPMDIFLVNPVLSLGAKAGKAMNLSTKMGKAFHAAGVGAGVGVASMATYEAATGYYRDDSLIESAVMGAALGGSLGFVFSSGSRVAPSLTNEVDATGRVLSKEEAQAEKLRVANEEKKALDDVIAEVEANRADQTQTKALLGESTAQDRGIARFNADLQQSTLGKAYEKATTLFEDLKTLIKPQADSLKYFNNFIKNIENGIITSTAKETKLATLANEIGVLNKEASPLRGQVTKLNNKLEKLKTELFSKEGADLEKVQKLIKETSDKLGKASKELGKVEAKLKVKENSHARQTEALTGKTTKDLEAQREAALAERVKAQVEYDKLLPQVQKAEADHVSARDAVRNFSKRQASKDNVTDSVRTKDLRKKLQALGFDLTADGLRALAEKHGVVTADLERMAGGDFNTSQLYGLRKEKQNYIDKLSKEMDSIEQVTDFGTQAQKYLKRLPQWTHKFLASPVSRLLNSANDKLAGFTSMLHSGTVYQGAIPAMTAWVLKNMHDNKINRLHKALLNNYREAVKNGYNGKLEDFDNEVGKELHRMTGNMQRQANQGIDGAIQGSERLAEVLNREGLIKRNHTHDNEFIRKSVDDFLNYYEGIHAYGKKLGLESFIGSLGKGYVSRIYSPAKIEQMGGQTAAIQYLVDAQVKYATATNTPLTQALRDEFTAIATEAVTGSMKREYLREVIGQSLDKTQRAGSVSPVKQRTLMAFDDDIMDVLEHSASGVSGLYGIKMHGKLALKEKLGVDNDVQLQALIDQLEATPRELKDMYALVDTIKGIREMSRNPYDPVTQGLKLASTYSSIMHTMAFGIPTITEVASVAKEFGWGRTIDKLVGTPSEIYRSYRYGTPSEKNSIELMISYADPYFAHKMNRMDVESSLFSANALQRVGDKIVNAEAVFSFLLPITDMLRMATASLSVDFVAGLSVAKKISKTDEMRLNDMGLTKDDLPEIQRVLQVDSTGRIGNMDRKSWGKLDDKLTAGVMTMVERTVLHPNGATLPRIMTNMNEGQIVPRLFMKFLRFPMESYERMLIRGVQEADAKQLMALGGNIAMWTAILSMKDAIKPPDKQQYHGEDGTMNLMKDSFIYNSYTAMPLMLMDMGWGAVTGKTMTNDYRYRIGGVIQADYESAQKGDFRFSVPLGGYNLGDAVGNAFNWINGLVELNKE